MKALKLFRPVQQKLLKHGKWKLVFAILGGGGLCFLFCLGLALIIPNATVQKNTYLYVPSHAGYADVMDSLLTHHYLKSPDMFQALAHLIGYPDNVKPGRYEICPGDNNLKLLIKLRAGRQAPVKLSFITTRTLFDLATKFSRYIEAPPDTVFLQMTSPDLLDSLGFNQYTAMSMYIPNTYEIYWNTSPKQLMLKLYQEYQKFWNPERKALAAKLQLELSEISTLASIVEAETNQTAEKPRIAGVYFNRIQTGMPLQADPTLVFAIGDFSIKRVLDIHKENDSPYNTYMYPGLPPGPINCPSIASIDAVLNYERHDFYFFCARSDFSGFHDFSINYEDHIRLARKYRKALDRLQIKNTKDG